MKKFAMILITICISISAFGQENQQKDAYLLDSCIVSGQKLGGMGEPVVYLHEGREIKFCCQGCVSTFKKDPNAYLKKLDEALIQYQMPFYPMNTCVVTGEKLGKMGEPVNYVYHNRLVRFCCKGCISTFSKEPNKYLTILKKAIIEKQLPSYPLNTCVVTGQELDKMGKVVNFVYANRLIRFCCKGCIPQFLADPMKYMQKLDGKK